MAEFATSLQFFLIYFGVYACFLFFGACKVRQKMIEKEKIEFNHSMNAATKKEEDTVQNKNNENNKENNKNDGMSLELQIVLQLKKTTTTTIVSLKTLIVNKKIRVTKKRVVNPSVKKY